MSEEFALSLRRVDEAKVHGELVAKGASSMLIPRERGVVVVGCPFCGVIAYLVCGRKHEGPNMGSSDTYWWRERTG